MLHMIFSSLLKTKMHELQTDHCLDLLQPRQTHFTEGHLPILQFVFSVKSKFKAFVMTTLAAENGKPPMASHARRTREERDFLQ